MEIVHTTAHGKILWLGGYSVLEKPNLGYVTTVDAGIHAFVTKTGDNKVSISVPHVNAKVSGKVNTRNGGLSINAPEELKLIDTSIKIALMYISGLGIKTSGLNIRTTNDPPFFYKIDKHGSKISKAGLGSSAAVTVATVAAILKTFGVKFHENEALHKLSQLAHSIANGKVGSGYDIAAATYGDIIYSRYSPSIIESFPKDYTKEELVKIVKKKWDYSWTRLSMPQIFDITLANFVNKSAITTSMISGINQLKNKDPDRYRSLIEQINEQNLRAISAIEKINKNIEVSENLNMFNESFNQSRILTKQLGSESNVDTEPEDATKLIEKTIENGAFVAKLPGAGGHDSIAAIFLNNKANDGKDLKRVLKLWASIPSIHIINVKKFYAGFELENNSIELLKAK